MDETNQKILTNLDVPIQYLQSLYNISIDEINNENLEDYRKNINIPENISVEYYQFEKMFQYFKKLIKYYYRYNRTNANTKIKYETLFYLFYSYEFELLKIMIDQANDDEYKLSFLIKIKNISLELSDTPDLSNFFITEINNLYNSYDITSQLTSNIRSKFPQYVKYIMKKYSKELINNDKFIDPINKKFRNCKLLKDYECNEECHIVDVKKTIYGLITAEECHEKNTQMKNLFRNSSYKLNRNDIINFICSYEQYSDEDLFFQIEFDEKEYNNERLLEILNNLFNQGLNQKYPLENQYIIFEKCKLSVNDIIKLTNYIYNFIYKTKSSYFELYKYFCTILSKYTSNGDKLEKNTVSNMFYIILYNLEYADIKLSEIPIYMKLNKSRLNSYDFTFYNRFISNTIPIKLDGYMKIGDYDYVKYKIELLSGYDRYLDEYKYFLTKEFDDNFFNYEFYKSYPLSIYYSDKNIDINFEKATYKYKNLNYFDIKFYANKNTLNENIYTFKYTEDSFNLRSYIENLFKEPGIDIEIDNIPVVIKIDDQYVVIKNEEYFFYSIFLGNKSLTVKYIENYENFNNNESNKLGLNNDIVENKYIYPRLMSVLYLINKNQLNIPANKKYKNIVLVSKYNAKLKENILNIIDEKILNDLNIIELTEIDEKYINDDHFIILDENIETKNLINRLNYVIIKNENVDELNYNLDKIILNIEKIDQLSILIMKYINLNKIKKNVFEKSIANFLYVQKKNKFLLIFQLLYFLALVGIPTMQLFTFLNIFMEYVFLFKVGFVLTMASSAIIMFISNFIFVNDIDTVYDVGIFTMLFMKFSKKNKDIFLDYKNNQIHISTYFEQFKNKPKISLIDINFNLMDLGNFNSLSKKYPNSILYDSRFEDILYLFSSYDEKDLVFKIERYYDPNYKKNLILPDDPKKEYTEYIYDFTLLNKNFNMQSSCSEFSVNENYISTSINNLNSKCVKNNYNIDWIINLLFLLSTRFENDILISISNIDYLNEKSKNNDLIEELVKDKYYLLYDTKVLLNLINKINIKSILDNYDIKYSESLINDNKVYFEDYYNSTKNILMVNQLFTDIKNKKMIHRINYTQQDKINDIVETSSIIFKNIKSLFEKNDIKSIENAFKNMKSYNISSLDENDLIIYISDILSFIVNTPNYLMKK